MSEKSGSIPNFLAKNFLSLPIPLTHAFAGMES